MYIHRLIEEQYVDKDKPLEGPKTWRTLTKKTEVTLFLSNTHRYPDDDGYEIKKWSSMVQISSH